MSFKPKKRYECVNYETQSENVSPKRQKITYSSEEVVPLHELFTPGDFQWKKNEKFSESQHFSSFLDNELPQLSKLQFIDHANHPSSE